MTAVTSDDLDDAWVRARYAGGAERSLPALLEAADGTRALDGVTRAQVMAAAAEVLESLGRNADALAMYRRAAEAADGDWSGTHVRLGLARYLASAGQLDEADALLGEVAAAGVPDGPAYRGRLGIAASALAVAGDPARALAWFETVIGLEGQNPPDYLLERRRAVRRMLGLPEDRTDRDAGLRERARAAGRAHIVWWPQPEYDQLARRYPELAERIAPTWDEHRRQVGLRLRREQEAGNTPLLHQPGLAGLLLFVYTLASDPMADKTATGFDAFAAGGRGTEPPKPRQPCWCGSGRRYKDCCRER